MNYEIDNDGFKQHRHEVLTTRVRQGRGDRYVDPRPVVATSPGGLFSWGTQNTPVMTLRRNPIAMLLAAADAASDTAPVDDKTFNDVMAKHTVVKTAAGDELSLYFDPQRKFLIGVETMDTEALAGDVPARVQLRQFQDSGRRHAAPHGHDHQGRQELRGRGVRIRHRQRPGGREGIQDSGSGGEAGRQAIAGGEFCRSRWRKWPTAFTSPARTSTTAWSWNSRAGSRSSRRPTPTRKAPRSSAS